MSADVTGSALFLLEAGKMAQRLLEHQRSVFDFRYDGLAFGSWGLTAGTPKHRVSVVWDGREGEITVKAAGFSDSRERPAWRAVLQQRLEDRSPTSVLLFAERIILVESGAPAA